MYLINKKKTPHIILNRIKYFNKVFATYLSSLPSLRIEDDPFNVTIGIKRLANTNIKLHKPKFSKERNIVTIGKKSNIAPLSMAVLIV